MTRSAAEGAACASRMATPFAVEVASADFLASARRWISSALDAGMSATGPSEQIRIRPWSTQLVTPTTEGRSGSRRNARGSLTKPHCTPNWLAGRFRRSARSSVGCGSARTRGGRRGAHCSLPVTLNHGDLHPGNVLIVDRQTRLPILPTPNGRQPRRFSGRRWLAGTPHQPPLAAGLRRLPGRCGRTSSRRVTSRSMGRRDAHIAGRPVAHLDVRGGRSSHR